MLSSAVHTLHNINNTCISASRESGSEAESRKRGKLKPHDILHSSVFRIRTEYVSENIVCGWAQCFLLNIYLKLISRQSWTKFGETVLGYCGCI